MEQTTQMKVPQSAHGYPSDARSSLPQARQTIASPAVDVIRAK
jgi:cysteine sulfinate desulfinase/cysteine desulfurase-like protein